MTDTTNEKQGHAASPQRVVGVIAHIAATVGWQAGEPGMEIAGGIVSWLAANPDQIDRFMTEGGEMFVNGEIDACRGALTWRDTNGAMQNRASYEAAITQATGVTHD